MQRAEEKVKDFEARIAAVNLQVTEAKASLSKQEQERQSVQGELDDLLMVFGDLEDKVKEYKERLQRLGESVSDGEEDDEGEGEEDEGVD